MSTKKDTTDTSLDMTSETKKRPESKYNASILRECIKEGLDAKSIMEGEEYVLHRQDPQICLSSVHPTCHQLIALMKHAPTIPYIESQKPYP